MKKRIETKTSRTAEFTTLARCLSYLETREHFKTYDYISLAIMNDIIRPLLRFERIKRLFFKRFPKGLYEYVIARTKIIDTEFKDAIENDFEQIIIFGAGFDSRGVRIYNGEKNYKVYELDAPITQGAKKARYIKKNIIIPDNLVFIPIDFTKDSLIDRLQSFGVQRDRKTLFILEGLTMYIPFEAIDSTFRIIKDFAGNGSRIVFDYIYDTVVNRENNYKGERELYNHLLKNGEMLCFGIKKGQTNAFLNPYGFKTEKILDSETLEKLYFMNKKGNMIAHINQTHCIAVAVK